MWGSAGKIETDKILVLQKHTIRFISNKDKRPVMPGPLASTNPMFFNRFLSFKRITIELILLNPTKFEQIRKLENFRIEKKMLKKVCKVKLPLYITYKPVNII